MTFRNPVLLARDAIREFRGCEDILDALINKYNIKLELWNCMDRISGVLIVTDDYIAIGVNKNHPKTRQRFTIAHELGHFLLGHGSGMCKDGVIQNKNKERNANHFAAELLMPLDKINVMIEYGFSKELMAESFGVSIDAITLRLKHLRLYSIVDDFEAF